MAEAKVNDVNSLLKYSSPNGWKFFENYFEIVGVKENKPKNNDEDKSFEKTKVTNKREKKNSEKRVKRYQNRIKRFNERKKKTRQKKDMFRKKTNKQTNLNLYSQKYCKEYEEASRTWTS